ncbi:MAG: exonuclease domain-containing protein, partial [Bacteroidia bacterium]
ILVHDGLSVIDKFTTLLNPECHISSYYTSITNITNDMVSDAPKFHEVAKKIIEMTENCVFVAHNVGFDYNFIKDEFASLGYKYQRETLCTVRLSRKLIPGRISYSLGHLCASLSIEIFGRHRAEGDAVATAQLFDLLIQLKNSNPLYKNKGVVEIMTRRIDNIKKYILNKLPESCGVYYFLNKEGQIIYIGKSVNMYSRAQSHFNSDERKGKKMLNDLYNVDFVETGSELIALLLETEEIKKHKPLYNRKSKADVFTHSIDWYKNKEGIINFKIIPYEEAENSLIAFTNYLSTRERLENWIEEKVLCLQYCSLTNEGSLCFNHQIKKCNGVCAGEEEIEEYNKRAQQIVAQYSFHHPDFVIIEKGRRADENVAILIEKGHYVGYGYFDSSDNFTSQEELAGMVKRSIYYPDADGIVQAWLQKSRRKVIDFKRIKNFEDE